jgi:hypothetical protein
MISNKIAFRGLFSNSILPTMQQVRDSVLEFITLDLLDNDESDVTTMEAGLKLWTNLLSSEEEVAKKSDEEQVRYFNHIFYRCNKSNAYTNRS